VCTKKKYFFFINCVTRKHKTLQIYSLYCKSWKHLRITHISYMYINLSSRYTYQYDKCFTYRRLIIIIMWRWNFCTCVKLRHDNFAYHKKIFHMKQNHLSNMRMKKGSVIVTFGSSSWRGDGWTAYFMSWNKYSFRKNKFSCRYADKTYL